MHVKDTLTDEQAIALCEENDVFLAEAEEPEVKGEWNWLSDDRASEGFPTKAACAKDAVKELNLV